MRKNTNLLVTLFALLVFSSAANAQRVIDDFDSGGSLLQNGVGQMSGVENAADILGGQRDYSVEVQNVTDAALGVIGFNVGGNSTVSIGQGPSDQIIATLFYGSLGGFDLTDGGLLNSFRFELTSDSPVPINNVMQLTVTSGAQTASQFITIPEQGSSTTSVLSDFADYSLVNLGSVDSLLLNFNFSSDPGRDIELGVFEAVNAIPEPGSLAVLSMASLIVFSRRRR